MEMSKIEMESFGHFSKFFLGMKTFSFITFDQKNFRQMFKKRGRPKIRLFLKNDPSLITTSHIVVPSSMSRSNFEQRRESVNHEDDNNIDVIFLMAKGQR